ncbi:MAG: nitrite reductase (NAD(P)H) small subunit [Cellulomonas sp. 14-74-6]|jgi:nitrite reductase (NADH) small subunit|nr:MAG: nitrite reductase (NAD(P)H) small subunit [Cellulomonas sp. 14-74-6]
MSRTQPGWTLVCQLTDLVPERGAAALVDGAQVALFRVGDREVLAVQQLDPYSGAHVMSRGIVGSRAGAVTVASPMYKQVFDLRTGRCLDPVGKEPHDLRTWPVRVEDDVVLVGRAGTLVDALAAPHLVTPATLDAREAP